jgi:hypothetical protein
VPFLTTTDYLRPEQVRETIEGQERHDVRYVLWSPNLDVQDPRDRGGDHWGRLRKYLSTHYAVVKTFPNDDQFWQKILRAAMTALSPRASGAAPTFSFSF